MVTIDNAPMPDVLIATYEMYNANGKQELCIKKVMRMLLNSVALQGILDGMPCLTPPLYPSATGVTKFLPIIIQITATASTSQHQQTQLSILAFPQPIQWMQTRCFFSLS